MERKVILIAGPTCSGKTRVSIDLAKIISSEIISADSRQIYRHLNIGTAKPGSEELASVKHHLIDILEPEQDYNVSRFENDSLRIINEILSRGKIPVVVGGSGLYIHALVDGIFNEVDTDEEFRLELKEKMEKFGSGYLYDELKKVDPVSASKMLPQNWKRVMRSLEVFHITGRPIWQLQKNYKRETDLNFFQFGLDWPRATLYHNINSRVDKMIEKGLVEETNNLLNNGIPKTANSLNTVGYKEIISFLQNEITLDRAVELIKRNTRHYAKRQMTWFRKDSRINWISIESKEDLRNVPEIILNQISNLN